MEKDKISGNDFLAEYLTDFGSTRGCALLGKTSFDKLKTVREFLSGQGVTDDKLVVIDCPNETGDADSVIKLAKKYQKAPYVIFNRCEGLLCRNDVLKVFAHLLDPDEYSVLFPSESFYVFLGDENTLGRGKVENSDHLDSFCTFVNCYDFDKGRRYMGYNAMPVN
jgi:hypothetical protein